MNKLNYVLQVLKVNKKQLAEKLGVTPAAITKYEHNGFPPLRAIQLSKMHRKLKIDDLIDIG